jgi:hypothetical protein
MNFSLGALPPEAPQILTVEQVRRIAEIAALDKGGFPWWARLMLAFAFACSMAWFVERMRYAEWLAKRLAPLFKPRTIDNQVLELSSHEKATEDGGGHGDDEE